MNACDKRFCLRSDCADADFGSLSSYTLVAYVDVAITGGEVEAGITSDGDVGGASVVQERLETFSVLLKPVVLKKAHSRRWPCCFPSGVAIQCLKASRRVAAAHRIVNERIKARSRVIGACSPPPPTNTRACVTHRATGLASKATGKCKTGL